MPVIFLSGSLGMQSHRKRIYERTPHRLLSLHASYLKVASTFVREIADVRDTRQMELCVDSGAFTAWTKNEPDPDVRSLLKTYKRVAEFCAPKFKRVIFISLDKIPGAPGRTATHEEMKEAIRISDENHHILASELGDAVLPVFHQSEPVDRLHEVVALNSKYICISPRNDLKENQRRAWAHRAHQLIPGVDTHGLAVAQLQTLREVNFRSIDSAGWVQLAAYGGVLFPYNGVMQYMSVSEQNILRKRRFGAHADTIYAPDIQRALREYLDKFEITRTELQTMLGARELFNVSIMRELANDDALYQPTECQQTLIEL